MTKQWSIKPHGQRTGQVYLRLDSSEGERIKISLENVSALHLSALLKSEARQAAGGECGDAPTWHCPVLAN